LKTDDMPSYTIRFEVKRPNTIDFPTDLLVDGNYEFTISEQRGIELHGNRDGLLYLAEVLTRFALGGYEQGFHAHFPLLSATDGPNIDSAPELTIYAASEPDGEISLPGS
jgi:hypothetical protein